MTVVIITSTANEKLKHARRVRDGREEGLIFVEGQRLAEECLRSGLRIQACFHAPDPDARTEALLCGLDAHAVAPHLLATLGDTMATQGIIIIAERPVHRLEAVVKKPATLLVGLDRVQDPGNVGTLIRTAEAAGADGVILLKGSADPFSPKALRSAMGSAFRLPVIELAAPDGLELRPLQTAAAAGSGEMTHYEYDWRKPTLLWLGNEGGGLREELLARADVRLRIPLQAGVESLNVAAAGAAMLFEAVRQRSIGAPA